MVLNRKRTFERIEDSYEAGGCDYSINYEQEVSSGERTIVGRPAFIEIIVTKGGMEVARATYQDGNRHVHNYPALSSAEEKQINSTVIDIFDVVLSQE